MPLFRHPRDESDVAEGAIVSGAPFADPLRAGEHRDDEHIVELTRVPTRFESDVLVAALESRGIKASAVHSDAGGWGPNFAVSVGHRVMVFESDVETARAILAEDAGEAETDDAD